MPIFLKDGAICRHTVFGKTKGEKIECAIFCCHGGSGENGKLEAMFELSNIAVSAGSTLALGLSMDKWCTKLVAANLGIDCISGVLVKAHQKRSDMIERIESTINYPVIVKPNSCGSSIGIEIANNIEELSRALDVAFEFDTAVIVEKAIKNFDEFNCAVLGDVENFVVSDVDKPIKQNKILTFADKYLSCGKKEGMKKQPRQLPAKIAQKLTEQIKDWSKKIFVEFGFYPLCRIP